jgi:flagellar hook-associated protein 3 FlgL
MSTSVSTLEQSTQTLQYLQQLNSKASQLESQISTGQVSTTFSGIAPQASQLIDLQATQSQQQGYINTIGTVNTRLQTMSLAMQNIAQVATTFQNTLTSDAFNGSGPSIQQTAQQLLTEVGGYLNTQDGSRYVFSGNVTGTPTFSPTNLPNPGDLTTNVAADYYGGDNGVAAAEVAPNVNLQYGVTGNNTAFEQVIRVLNYYANDATPPSQTNPTDVANAQTAENMLGTAAQQVQALVADAGEQQSNLTTLSTAHQNAQTLATTAIGNIENVDSATAITQLNTLQTQLQASYQTINMLQGLSLVNYLK